MIAAIDVISQEDVVRVGKMTADFEKLEKIEELAVNIAANGDWSGEGFDIGFALKDFSGLLEKRSEVALVGDFALFEGSNQLINVEHRPPEHFFGLGEMGGGGVWRGL
jgi:hypothetical protein